jgi:hypothetical protein
VNAEGYNQDVMATESNITLPADLLGQVQAIALKEGKTADELTADLVKREVASVVRHADCRL